MFSIEHLINLNLGAESAKTCVVYYGHTTLLIPQYITTDTELGEVVGIDKNDYYVLKEFHTQKIHQLKIIDLLKWKLKIVHI